MKKALSIVLLFAAISAAAQQEIRIVGTASPTFSWLTTRNPVADGGGLRVGLDLGLTAEMWRSPNFSLTGGVHLLLGLGGKIVYQEPGHWWAPLTDTHFDGETKLKLSYVSLPMGIKYQTAPVKGWQIWGSFDPLDLRILLGAKASSEALGVENVKARRMMHPLGLAWNGGLGATYEFPGGLRVLGGLGISSSWTAIKKKGGDDNYRTAVSYLQLRLGVYF